MSPPESQSAQRWLTHGRNFQRNIPDLLTECAAPSAEACCRRDAARSLFLSTRAVGRPPSTSFLPERAVPCFHFLSAAARAPVPPLRVGFWTGGCAGHQIQRLQKHRSLSAIHTKVLRQAPFSNELPRLRTCALDFLRLLPKQLHCLSLTKTSCWLLFFSNLRAC